MGASLGNGKGFVSEINVTPFVDVMLVLLIIFMITAPLMTEGVDVDLPQTKSAATLPTDKDHIILTIRKNGTVYVDTYAVTDLEHLEAQIRAVATDQKRQVFLQADKDVPYGTVVAVIGHIRSAGIDKLGMVAEQPQTGAAGTAPPSGATPPAKTPAPSPRS
ncbi:Protein TolR [uncultured delta proteobacterium]|uniref:Protein TolR n=1 Tax=uncultured delta proteobacterium TaxID=34034 RepID=A0A212KD86_9DELT|nr:Protein TolR [uncultured delta proteobacterium]